MEGIHHYRHFFLLSTILIVILAIGAASFTGSLDKERHESNQEVFELARNQVNSGDAELGLDVLLDLTSEYDDSPLLHWQIGSGYKRLGELEPAIDYYVEAQQYNADLANHAPFVIEFGILLDEAGYQEADLYLEQSLKLDLTNDQFALVNDLLLKRNKE